MKNQFVPQEEWRLNMISENLLTLRKMKHFSQEEVAGAIGVSRQAVAKWESGETTPDITNCIALAKLYEVSLDDLVNYSPAETGLGIPPKGKYMFGIVKLGEKGQIVIPKRAREVFGLKPGDGLVILGDEAQGIAIAKADDFLAMARRITGMMAESGNAAEKGGLNENTKGEEA